ncbi:hypothetical protein ACWEQL_01740 [Kitasatospora sp. NPDC004240]
MLTGTANGYVPPSPFWLRVREFAVPPSMIETATARRRAGDWAGACAAANVDIDLDLRTVTHRHGRVLASALRADLRRLAPDLLRWHLPRIAPDGLLRPGLTVPLARYGATGHDGPGPLQLVARTPPAPAAAGQRISLALWDGSRASSAPGRVPDHGRGRGPDHSPGPDAGVRGHPHPRPGPRFRLDLHRHLWDADRAGELRTRSGAGEPVPRGSRPPAGLVPPGLPCAVDRWAAEARILLRAEGLSSGTAVVRLGPRYRLLLDLPSDPGDGPQARPPVWRLAGRTDGDRTTGLPVLPDAAIWLPPDLELLRAGLIGPEQLHPLVAAALVPGHRSADPPPQSPTDPPPASAGRLVDCQGARHRIGMVDGVLAALDHDPAELRREELLAALGGTQLPCLQMIDRAHRRPESLDDIRARLDHGDTAGALAAVEALLGPDALLRHGALRDALEDAAHGRVAHGLFRAGLLDPDPGPGRPLPRPHPDTMPRSRHAYRR